MKRRKTFALCGVLSLTMAAAGLTGCSSKVDGTATALVVGEEEVSLGTANFILRYQQAETLYMMQSYGMVSEGSSMWDSTVDSGTYGEQFKDNIKDDIVEMVLLRQHASEYNVTISDEYQEQIESAAKTIMESNADAMDQIGATQENVEEMMELYTYKTLMKDPMVEDTDREVSDEEAAQTRITYSRIKLTGTDDDGNTTDLTDEEKASLKEECQELLDQVQASADPANEDISTLAEAIDEDFLTSGVNYSTNDEEDTTIDDAVKEAVSTLSDGQVYDGIIETDDYYYVVRLDHKFDEDATETKKQSIISEREDDNYDSKVQEWKDATSIEEKSPWKKLKVTDKDAYVVKTADSTATSTSSEDTSSASSSSVSTSSAGTESTSAASSSSVSASAASTETTSVTDSSSADSTSSTGTGESSAAASSSSDS